MLVGCNASLPSRHILIIDTSTKILFTVFPYIYSNPYFTVGLQYQATWRALCLGLCIRHDSRGVGKVLRSSKPLNFQGPCSLVVVLRPELPPVFETRVSPLFEVRVPPVLIEA